MPLYQNGNDCAIVGYWGWIVIIKMNLSFLYKKCRWICVSLNWASLTDFITFFLHIEAETKWLIYETSFFCGFISQMDVNRRYPTMRVRCRWHSESDCVDSFGIYQCQPCKHDWRYDGSWRSFYIWHMCSIDTIIIITIIITIVIISSNHDHHHYHHYTYNYHHSLYHLWVLVAIFHGRSSDFFDFHCQL